MVSHRGAHFHLQGNYPPAEWSGQQYRPATNQYPSTSYNQSGQLEPSYAVDSTGMMQYADSSYPGAGVSYPQSSNPALMNPYATSQQPYSPTHAASHQYPHVSQQHSRSQTGHSMGGVHSQAPGAHPSSHLPHSSSHSTSHPYGSSYPQSYRHRSHSQSQSYSMPPGMMTSSSTYPGPTQVPLTPTTTQYTASSSRPFSCDLCALSFNRQHDLKRHRETHTGEKPYLCNGGCGKTFTRKDALKRHQLVKGCGKVDDGWS
ncbi:hypothetical protein D9758_001892 [Tetrapyrgos nigripes]|uniref:C2H2-type domain-containing protein n=2 Tax=Agaricales TaxID=5338 RepID=A0A8H5LVD7_9AGAR|nr:hypothetical protein D9758_001892 [Tetrapyrgos nigripes]